MSEKLTLKDLLEKDGLTEPCKLEYESEVLGGVLAFEKINPDTITEILTSAKETGEMYRPYLKMIYKSCKLLRSKELAEKYAPLTEPYDVVDKVFNNNIGEIFAFGNQILKAYGLLGDKPDPKK